MGILDGGLDTRDEASKEDNSSKFFTTSNWRQRGKEYALPSNASDRMLLNREIARFRVLVVDAIFFANREAIDWPSIVYNKM